MTATEHTNGNRLVLLTIIGIPVTMILAATWLWYFVVEGDLDLVGVLGTANRGTLVQPPRSLDEAGLRTDNGLKFSYADDESRWTLLVPVAGDRCGPRCESRLYTTRQIHVAMGKNFNRIRRFLVTEQPPGSMTLSVAELSDRQPAPQDFAAYLAGEHRGLKALQVTPEAFAALFPEQRADEGMWYLVDPAGWIMMSYNEDIPYRDVMSDLKFLLKNSSD